MTIDKLGVPDSVGTSPRIAVIGVGGGGGNTVNRMANSELSGVDLIATNTDTQDLSKTDADFRLQLGPDETGGYGAGTDAEVGRKAAEESIDDIRAALSGVSLVFLTAGMGGGTGTGALPVIGRIARELNVLTVGVVTRPFDFEGEMRMKVAISGITEAARQVDTLLVIANQNLLPAGQRAPSLLNAFKIVDDVLLDAVRGVVDLVVRPGIVNLDFADLSMVLREGGIGVIGAGEAEGTDRGMVAAQRAAENRLLDGISLDGARSLLINVTGGDSLDLADMDAASEYLSGLARKDVRMKVGAVHDPSMEDRVRVYVAASGVTAQGAQLRAGMAVHATRAQRHIRPSLAAVPNRPQQKWGNSGILNQNPKQSPKVRVVGSTPAPEQGESRETAPEPAVRRSHPGMVAPAPLPAAPAAPPPAAAEDRTEDLWSDDFEIDAGAVVSGAPQEPAAPVPAPSRPEPVDRNPRPPFRAAPQSRPPAPQAPAVEEVAAAPAPIRPNPSRIAAGGAAKPPVPEAGAEQAEDGESASRGRNVTRGGKGLITRILAAG